MPSSVNPASGFVGAAGPKQPLAVKSPKQFIADKRPKSDVERVACLGYYLTHFRETPEFKTRDITMLNREAAQPALGNPAMAVANAARVSQYLSSSGGGKKQLTSRGEALVESLPDRERVREALETFPSSGERARRSAGEEAQGSRRPGHLRSHEGVASCGACEAKQSAQPAVSGTALSREAITLTTAVTPARSPGS